MLLMCCKQMLSFAFIRKEIVEGNTTFVDQAGEMTCSKVLSVSADLNHINRHFLYFLIEGVNLDVYHVYPSFLFETGCLYKVHTVQKLTPDVDSWLSFIRSGRVLNV